MFRFLTFACLLVVITLTSCGNHSKQLNKVDFGDDWPFKVESGKVECLDGYVVVFKTGGKAYALNDAARVTDEFENIRDILRPDANYPGKKITMDLSLIEFEGLKLCDR